MTSVFPGQSGAQSHLGGTGLVGPQPIPPPPSFADFRFTTIGQEPKLLKRISAPEPDFQYNEDRASPTLSFRYPSQTPEVEPPRSRPSLLQALTDSNDHADTDMPDAADEMAIDSPSGRQTETPQIEETKANQLPSTNLATPHGPRGWSDKLNGGIIKPVPTRPRSSTPLTTSVPSFQEISRVSSNATNPVSNVDATPSAPAPTHIPNTNELAPPPGQPLPSHSGQGSQYTPLRALQARLMSSLSNLNVPDTSNALLLVQAANTHSANALSTAHRSHTLAQQALASAREAVSAAQECLSAAEEAKVHASDAVAAVEQVGAGGTRGPNSEWEWKTIISGLQDDLHALGEWVGEREGEEAAKRRETERMEKAKKDKDSVDSAMQMVEDGLPPQVVQAMADEVVKRVAEEMARSKPKPSGAAQAFSPTIQQQELHRAAELEADDARRAWSLENRHPSKPKSTIPAEEGLGPQTPADEAQEEERRRALESATLLKQAKLKEELRKREAEARLQQERRETEIKAQRLRELELQKLEVAKFQMLERERQAQQEAERTAADALRARQETEQRKFKEAEVAEARRAKRAHLEEQAKRAAAQAAVLKAEIIAREEEAKAAAEAEAKAAEKKEEEARAAEARAEEARAVEARAAEVKAAEARAAEAKAAEEQAAAKAAEAREIELREAQSRKRQEVMAQKQRASAETAARILAERARERELNDNPTPPVNPSRSPETLTHPLPSPVFQTVALPSSQAASPLETAKSKGRAISGGVTLGTLEEPAENSVPPSPSLTRSMALGLRSKKDGRPIPLPLPVPRPKAKHDKKEGSAPSQADSAPVTPPTGSSELPDSKFQPNPTWAAEHLSVHRRSRDPGNLPIVPRSQLPPTSPEAQKTNLRFVRDRNGVSRDTYLKRDPGAVAVKSEPLAEVKLSSPPSGVKRKVTEQAGPALPKRPKVRQGGTPTNLNKASQSPVVPPTPVLPSAAASPHMPPSIATPANDGPNIPPQNTTSPDPQPAATQSTLLSKSVADSFTTAAPIPSRLKANLPNFRIRKPSGSTLESPSSTSRNTPTPSRPKVLYPCEPNASPRVPPTEPRALPERGRSQATINATTSAPTPTSPGSNTQTDPELSTELIPYQATNSDTSLVEPQRATTPTPQQTTTLNLYRDNASASSSHRPTAYQETIPNTYDDGAQIAPAIHGDGGWDAPAEGDEEPYHNSFRGREAPPRQYTSRDGDHYSPPARTPPRSHSPLVRRPAPNPQEIRRIPNNNYVAVPPRRPTLYISTAPTAPRARTPPPPRALSPLPMRSPHLGKRRRWVGDEPPSHRYWQDDAEHDRTGQLFRPRSAHTPPPTRLNRRSLTPERFEGLQSRIGVRDADVYNVSGGKNQSYRPSYPSDSYYPSQPRRVSDSYQPTDYAGYEQDFDSSRVSLPGYDRYMPSGRHEVAERPDLLERMSAGAPTPTRGRGAGPTRGFNRGRGGRGGAKPLEQRISSNNNKNPMTLMNRLEV